MKKLTFALVMLLFICAALATARPLETYFRFKLDYPEQLAKLTRIISIDNLQDGYVYAYANEEEMAEFLKFGLAYEELPHPSTLIIPEMATDKDAIKAWDVYPTYNGYINMMNSFATSYPNLCQIINIGTTVEGRALLFAKISDNVATQEDEPEVLYTSTIHGDETTGYVLCLRLIDYLLTNYGSDSLVTRLVDSCEIWINPLANPDGTYNNGDSTVYQATRNNANGKDLNRNFPDPEDGPNPGGTWQPETIAMMNFAADHTIVISANFHGGVEVINYPWDTQARLHADNNWMIDISRHYADSAQYYGPAGYMDYLNNGITNGYAWYEVDGGRQDYMTYFHHAREVTAEISNTKLIPAAQLPSFWNYNKSSFLNYLENGLYGIRGVITDASTSQPILAQVRVLNHDSDLDSSMVFTDPDVGDYHRMIKAGTYDVVFSAPGYYPDTSYSVVVGTYQTVRIDVALTPLPNEPVLTFVSHNAGLVDAGDTIDMNITLSNQGIANAYNPTGILSSGDGYITIIQNSSTYPTIAALGGTGQSLSQYRFAVDPLCPLNHSTQFRLDLTADGGYVDSVFFTIIIGQQVENFESGSFATYPWVMGGTQPWVIVTTSPYQGIYCAKSGTIGNSQRSTMELTAEVLTAGNISFYYKVSSEPGYDTLKFYIDSSLQGYWSGTVAWTNAIYPVGTGSHTFKWSYAKDNSQAGGSDCAWIDLIVFPHMRIVPDITTTSLPNWTAGYPYSVQLQATGGMGTLTWDDKNNELQGTGLSLSSSGLVSGTPLNAGPISFTARVTDSQSNSDEKLFSFTINPHPDITTLTLTDWTISRPYSQQLQATGGTGALTWSDRDAGLSGTGLSMSSTGLISGTPTSARIIDITARTTDNVGAYDDQGFTFVINPAPVITTDTLPDGIIGEPYSFQLSSTGGTGDKTWSDKYSQLSGTGLSLSATGLLSGIPLVAGNSGFYAEIEDIAGAKVNKPLGYKIKSSVACGDANNDGSVDVSDAVWIINYVFVGGDPPDPLKVGDVNCDTSVDVSDAVWIINFVFVGGYQPCDTDGDGSPEC